MNRNSISEELRAAARFKNYTRSSAFRLELNARAINTLCWMHYCNEERRRAGQDVHNRHRLLHGTGGDYLERRGLVHLEPAAGETAPHYSLTEAGELTARLLELAGFGYEPGDMPRRLEFF